MVRDYTKLIYSAGYMLALLLLLIESKRMNIVRKLEIDETKKISLEILSDITFLLLLTIGITGLMTLFGHLYGVEFISIAIWAIFSILLLSHMVKKYRGYRLDTDSKF